MSDNKRFTIMTFPQHFDGVDQLQVNILFLPRTQNPLKPAIENDPLILDPVTAFADARLTFKAAVLNSLDKFPNIFNEDEFKPAPTDHPLHKAAIFTTLADGSHFNIDVKDGSNELLKDPLSDQKNKPRSLSNSIKKYLPATYRKAFNFIAPKLKGNGVTDDTYHCAVRNATPVKDFPRQTDIVSWGKVFAHILRNPLLAEATGFIYKTTIEINTTDFAEGGWLYIDLADDSDYKAAADADTAHTFIKKYAARIPHLKSGKLRQLFAANLFPVLIKAKKEDVDPPAPGKAGAFDNVFIEAADYDDGFGKILHSFQAVSQHLLNEKSDGFHPTHDSGIRLGWDDEQILQWYIRQMAEDEPGSGSRLDAPTGVMGFHVDVREENTATWNPLNKVQTLPGIDALGGLVPNIDPLQFTGELPYQVYPATLDGDPASNFWLPMYFANWNGHSMVLPDRGAIAVYQQDKDVLPDVHPVPGRTGTNVTASPQNKLLKVYQPLDINTTLKYGGSYDFRVRYTDITNGGPGIEKERINDALKDITNCKFRRYVAPVVLRVKDVPSDGSLFNNTSLKVKRPLLGYPAVVYTDKYKTIDAMTRLLAKMEKQLLDGPKPGHDRTELSEIGLADPDVDRVEITVEIQSLKMDYQNSLSGKESYAFLYTTERKFNTPQNEDEYEEELEIPIQYKDVDVLKFGDENDLGDIGVIPDNGAIILPTARHIRISVRAICEDKKKYYGLENDDPAYNTKYGRTSYINLYKESGVETALYSVKTLQGIYLQPDELPLAKPIISDKFKLYVPPVTTPDSVQRLAQQLKIENNGLNLVGRKGERIQFGCSARIGHTLAPDNSALTFASKEELYNHWLCCITLDINRDWTWDALEDLSLIISRRKYFKNTLPPAKSEIVGEIEIKKSISFNALQNPDRTYTKIIFIDAIEPKKTESDTDADFPSMLEVEYTVKAVFKENHSTDNDGSFSYHVLQLPVTVNPVQIPKIASAGIALSPYHRNDKYSSTVPRRRFLWIEFEQPVHDPNDLYFARVMAYSPDQLLSNNNPSLEKELPDAPINLDPEFIRVVMPGSGNDNAGINAMQPMEKSLLSGRHYLLPLPSGINESSPELFGFFAYEFRVGHAHKDLWSTAQGRFGRPLKATGIQHPAPTLTCAVNRDEEKLYVTAPYATAVFGGKNVTANPPRTQLWCLLYAQIKQADNNDATKPLKDYRNILLEDRFMHWSYKIMHNERIYQKEIDFRRQIGMNERLLSPLVDKKLVMKKMNINDLNLHYIKPVSYADLAQKSQDATKYGTTFWSNKEIDALLEAYGLPLDLSLSVLCVEVFGNITNEQEYRTKTSRFDDLENIERNHQNEAGVESGEFSDISIQTKPLSNSLGNYRILRTSPLVEVPFVCCTE